MKSGAKQGCLSLLFLVSVVLEVLDGTIRQENKMKGVQIGKRTIKLSPLTGHRSRGCSLIIKHLLSKDQALGSTSGQKPNKPRRHDLIQKTLRNAQNKLKNKQVTQGCKIQPTHTYNHLYLHTLVTNNLKGELEPIYLFIYF